MFEARLKEAQVLKKIIEAIKDLVADAPIECSSDGISMQSMDSSHVALVSLNMQSSGFEQFRCDRSLSLGLSMASVSKVLKCAGNDDAVTIRADDDGDTVAFVFENEGVDRVADFELKLIDIDAERLSVPETEYKAKVRMPAGEFQRIVRDLMVLGDTCVIKVGKDGITFSVKGDLGTGNITRKNKLSEKDDESTLIEMEAPVELTFALRYLNYFTKATPLASQVSIHLSADVPLMVEYKVEKLGALRFYLAPKIDEEAA